MVQQDRASVHRREIWLEESIQKSQPPAHGDRQQQAKSAPALGISTEARPTYLSRSVVGGAWHDDQRMYADTSTQHRDKPSTGFGLGDQLDGIWAKVPVAQSYYCSHGHGPVHDCFHSRSERRERMVHCGRIAVSPRERHAAISCRVAHVCMCVSVSSSSLPIRRPQIRSFR